MGALPASHALLMVFALAPELPAMGVLAQGFKAQVPAPRIHRRLFRVIDHHGIERSGCRLKLESRL
jgi:hypothetical protein